MHSFLLSALLSLLISSSTLALPDNHTDSLVNAAIDNGTFHNPSVNVRPRFRYWIPDASVDHAALASDVKEAKRVGGGGIEVLGYYLYGATPQGEGDYAPDDWTVYGWGLKAWNRVFETVAKACQRVGVLMDFAMGPNQGQGVPAPQGAEGTMYDLRSYNVTVKIGGSWEGTIPGWNSTPGAVRLEAVVTGLVIDTKNITVATRTVAGLSVYAPGTFPALPNDVPLNRTQATLSSDSLRDITDQVSEEGHLSVSFPNGADGLYYEIFFVYLIHASYRVVSDPIDIGGPQSAPKNFRQNGSWAADHYSEVGARLMIDYWEKYIIPEGSDLKQLVQDVGNYAWEDSIETRAEGAFYTANFSRQFEQDHGYSVLEYLPIIMHQNTHGTDNYFYTWWVLDKDADYGNGQIADYRQTLQDLYGVYLTTLESWAEDYLNLQFSAQITYNLPGDMLQNIPLVGAPECETLGFYHIIDSYRQYTGPANLAQKRLVSSEIGAIYTAAYQETFPAFLWDVKRSIAGSVTQFVIHGFPYSGYYPNTTWPGWTVFEYAFSQMNGPRQPGWEFEKDGMVDFIARHSFIFQSGIPKIDIAFYQFWTTYPYVPRNYRPTDLEERGYTYEYISPNNFDLPQATVRNGVLAPDAQEFKTLVIRANDSMSVEGADGVAEFAHAGLPIIFSGGLPNYTATANESASKYVQKTLRGLTHLKNVHQVPYEGLAETISGLGIKPMTKIEANNTWYTFWRQTDDRNYVFVYNDAYAPTTVGLGNGYSEGTVEFASVGKPYFLDAWSGLEIPITNYTQTSKSTTIPFQLAGNQSVIVAFDYTQPSHASYNSSSKHYNVRDPSQYYPPASASGSIDLNSWTLVIEHWDPPKDLSNMLPSDTVKYNTTHTLSNGVQPWKDISPSLTKTSGIGYYNTTINYRSTSNHTDGAIIDFGAIFHSIQVTVNGERLPPLDLTWAKADISYCLVEGENKVEVVVSTPLWNTVKPIWDDLESSGTPPSTDASDFPYFDYGLVSPVKVIQYRR